MEIEKPVTLGDKFAAARERRERLEKEREAARQETLNKTETAARRKSQIQAQTETERKQRRDSISSKHDEARERREVILRQKKEKALSELEKGEARSREAQKKKRWSWNGAVHGTWWYNFTSEIIAEGGGDDGGRPRPTAMPRSMQSWIGSLRGGLEDDNESLNGSSVGTPRDCKSQNSSFCVPDRLLTPTASSRAKRFGKPDGQTSSPPSVNGDSSLKESKLRRRTISHEHLNRLAQPRVRTVSSERHPVETKPKPPGRTTPQPRSRTTSRESSHVLSSSSRPKPDGSETPSASKFSKTPDAKATRPAKEVKPRSASVTPRHPRTSGVGSSTKDTKSDASLKPSPRQQAPKKFSPKPKPAAQSTKSVSVKKPTSSKPVDEKLVSKAEKSPKVKKADSPPPSNPEETPKIESEAEEAEKTQLPAGVPATEQLAEKTAVEAVVKPVNPLDVPLPAEDELSDGNAQSPDESLPVSVNDSEQQAEQAAAPALPEEKTENPTIQSLKEHSAVSIVSSSATSLHSDVSSATEATTENELHIQGSPSNSFVEKAFEKPLTSVEPGSSNDDDRLQKTVSFDDTVEVSEIPSNSKEGKTEEEAAKEDKKLKKKKKKEKKERKEKKKRDEKSKNSMLESWLNDSAADHESSVSPELLERESPVSPESQKPSVESINESEEQNIEAASAAAPTQNADEDEYKRRLREKKEKFRQEQAAKEEEQKAKEKAEEENRKRIADAAAAARLAKEREEAKKTEDEKEQLETRISENVRRADQEREEKRQAEEIERLARKKRIEEIMKRTRGSENSNFPSSSQINERISQRQNGTANGNSEISHDDVGARARSLLGSFQNLRMGASQTQNQSSTESAPSPEQINTEGS